MHGGMPFDSFCFPFVTVLNYEGDTMHEGFSSNILQIHDRNCQDKTSAILCSNAQIFNESGFLHVHTPVITTGDFIIKKVGKNTQEICKRREKGNSPCSAIRIGVSHKFFLPLRIQASLNSGSPFTN
jgi:hypothetical protein